MNYISSLESLPERIPSLWIRPSGVPLNLSQLARQTRSFLTVDIQLHSRRNSLHIWILGGSVLVGYQGFVWRRELLGPISGFQDRFPVEFELRIVVLVGLARL